MPRRPRTPGYCHHKASAQAVVRLDGHDHYLGPYDSPESHAEYNRLIAQWHLDHLHREALADLSVNELLLAFWRHAKTHYRHADGKPTSELVNFRLALEPVKDLCGHTRAAAFDTRALKSVRERMVQKGRCRTRVNRDVQRIKHVFRWAASEMLVPASVPQLLNTLEGLRQGRTPAHETEPIKPVAEEVVAGTLPFLRPQTAAMVQLQLLTGMRPGEVVIMRTADVDRTGKVWIYRPYRHKTGYRGHARMILIGPRGQEVLKPWLRFDQERYLFVPVEAEAQRSEERRAARKTSVYRGKSRRKAERRRAPGECYSVGSYARAVRRACVKADAAAREKALAEGMPTEEAAEKTFVPHWHPNQLRHTKATEIRRAAGLDAARVVLGHRSPQVTEVYAELDTARAAEVMEKLG